MFVTDIRHNLSKIRKYIYPDAKILNLSHRSCMDGSGAQIVLANCLKNVEYKKVSFYNINEEMDKIDFSQYDCVLITDVSPTDKPEMKDDKNLYTTGSEFFEKHDNIILLDHHDSANRYNDPENLKFVYNGVCGAVMTKIFCEEVLGVDLFNLNLLMYLVNDYDMWILDDPRSKQLATLFYYYWDMKFMKRFLSGDVTLTQSEDEYIEEQRLALEKTWDELNIFDLDSINGCMVVCEAYANDICERLLKEKKYGVIFLRNPKSKTMSIRVNEERVEVKMGKLLTELGVGGGHDHSAGTQKIGNDEIESFVMMMEKELYNRYESLRK